MDRRSSSASKSPNPNSSVNNSGVVEEEEDAETKTVNITVQKEHTRDVRFRVKRTAELSKLMLTYCRQMGLTNKGFKFAYLGKQVRDTDTPFALNMEDDDVIDCFADQVGGRARGCHVNV